MRALGLVLIVLGIVGLVWGGFSYTRHRKVLEIGSMVVRADETRTIPIPPIVGGIALVAGVVLLTADRRRAV